MGWFLTDAPGHEGYCVALVVEEVAELRAGVTFLRELTYYQDHAREIPPGGLRPEAFQVGCDCGWRSPRFHPPLGARWVPYSLILGSDPHELEAAELWRVHVGRELLRESKEFRAAFPVSHLIRYQGR